MMVSRLFLSLVLLSVAAAVQAGDSEAREWLERMSQSLATRNYEGRFFRVRDARSESMRIIHRVEKGKVTERLVARKNHTFSLNRDGRDTESDPSLRLRRSVVLY